MTDEVIPSVDHVPVELLDHRAAQKEQVFPTVRLVDFCRRLCDALPALQLFE